MISAAYIITVIQKLPMIALGLIGIGTVMAFHEFGHFIFAKLFNVHAPQFSIGMGPKLISKKIGETTFSISLVPVGAYVEVDNDPKTAGGKERTISEKSYWQKMLIISGGVLFNILFAYIVFVGLSFNGIPSNPILASNSSHSVEKVLEKSAAYNAGIQPKDKIIKIGSLNVAKNIGLLLSTIRATPHKKTSFTIERNGKNITVPVCIGSKVEKDKECGTLGIHFSFPSLPPVSLKQSFIQAAELVTKLLKNTFNGLKQSFTKKTAAGFAGPLMMISLTVNSAQQGMSLFFLFLAFISIGLAAINVIPLAVLDGGHALIYTIEAIIRKPLNETAQQAFQYVSLFLLGSLFIYLTFKDVIMLFFS